MYIKTTSTNYLKYGIVTNSFLTKTNLVKTKYTVTDDTVYSVTRYDHSVYIEQIEGMGMLRIMRDPRIDTPESFALHRSIRINAGNYFAIVPMYGSFVYNMYMSPDTESETIALQKPIPYIHIVPRIMIDEIIAYYYVVKRPGYVFPGEAHNFYELTYVDHGSLETTVDGKLYNIKSNQIMVYGPGQYHDQKITSKESCSYLTVIFEAKGIDGDKLLNRVFSVSRSSLNNIVNFVKATDDPGPYKNDEIIAELQHFLVSVMADADSSNIASKISPTTPINQHYENQLVEEIIDYINKHLYEPLPIEQVCDRFSISRSTLQNLFKNNLRVPPKQYINDAKLDRSRTLIRSGEHTISEVASLLGYNSIHYFSRKFTAYYGVTPSEYARKIYDQHDADND